MANDNTITLNKKTSGDTVTIGCKLPHGLALRVFNVVERAEAVMGGGSRMVKVGEPREQVYIVFGWAHPQNAAPHCTIIGGYAMTAGIPKEHWDLWLSQNTNSAMVKNGLIFAQNTVASAKDQAKDGQKIRSNMERLDPNNLPKVGKQKVQTATDMMAKEQLDRISDAGESQYV